MKATAAPATDPAALLVLEGVTVQRDRTRLLSEVSLTVSAGDLVCLVGPDGAGKSTLLRVLVGLVKPSEGTVTRRLGKESIGFCGADFDLYPDLTVHENLEFFGRVRGLRKEELARREDALASLVGLTEARDRLAGDLSGGMKKKLALAAALLHRPALLLLDEPTAGVDSVSRRELWNIIADVGARGAAVVYTTTYLEEAERAQRVLFIAGGAIQGEWLDGRLQAASGWSAWLFPGVIDRKEVRRRLKHLREPGRASLRADGLVLLAPDAETAAEDFKRLLGHLPTSVAPVLRRVDLTLEDLFVLAQLEEGDGSTS